MDCHHVTGVSFVLIPNEVLLKLIFPCYTRPNPRNLTASILLSFIAAPTRRFLDIILDCCKLLNSTTSNYIPVISRMAGSLQVPDRATEQEEVRKIFDPIAPMFSRMSFVAIAKNLYSTEPARLPVMGQPVDRNPRILHCQLVGLAADSISSCHFKLVMSNHGLAAGFQVQPARELLEMTEASAEFLKATGMLEQG